MERRWYRAGEIAEYLNLSEKTIYLLCSRGVLPSSKIKGIGLRIDIRKVDDLLERYSFESILEQI